MEFLLTFVVTIFLAGFILSRLLPWLIRFWLKRVQKRYHMEHSSSLPKKRIDQSEGDYIDFEEIE